MTTVLSKAPADTEAAARSTRALAARIRTTFARPLDFLHPAALAGEAKVSRTWHGAGALRASCMMERGLCVLREAGLRRTDREAEV